MTTLTLPGSPESVQASILSRSGSPAGTAQQHLGATWAWGGNEDHENEGVADRPRDLTGNVETRQLWKANDIADELAAGSAETKDEGQHRVKHSDSILGDLAERAGYLDASCVDEVMAYAGFHLRALMQVMDPYLDGDRNGPAEELIDGFVSSLHRKANRYRTKFHRANADLTDLERAWIADEIQIARRQELEEERDRTAEISARFDLLFQVATEVFEAVCGKAWTPPQSKTTNVAFAAAGAAAAVYINSRVSGPVASATKRIVIMGGEDASGIVKVMDAIQAKHGATITIYTGSSDKGVEASVRGICKERGIPCIAYGPDFHQHKRRAGFARNELMMAEAKPHGVVIIGGSGVQADVMNIAKKMNVTVWEIKAPEARSK